LKDIEIEFNQHLARVYDKGSYNSGVKGCEAMIRQHLDNPQAATAFLRALTDKDATQIAKT